MLLCCLLVEFILDCANEVVRTDCPDIADYEESEEVIPFGKYARIVVTDTHDQAYDVENQGVDDVYCSLGHG